MNNLLEAARREEATLLRRLAVVRELIREYGGEPVAVDATRAQEVARTNSTDEVLAAADRAFDARPGESIPLKELLAAVEAAGLNVGGKRPAATLSAMLSNAGRYKSTRGHGWRKRTGVDEIEIDFEEAGKSDAPAGSSDTAEQDDPLG